MESGPPYGRHFKPPSNSSSSRSEPPPPQVVFNLISGSGGGGGRDVEAGGNNNGGADSPESVSLYSDEIPSGYNSGEQYDTLSTGYMSGEAYELPDTRMDLQQHPALDIIEECLLPLGDGANDDSDAANIFVLPHSNMDNASISSSSTETSTNAGGCGGGDAAEASGGVAAAVRSPNYAAVAKSKLRKNVCTFAIPVESTPLGLLSVGGSGGKSKDEDYGFDVESSDPGMGGGGGGGGYRTVPSDTDTSAFDSDVNRANKPAFSDTELLGHASQHGKTKADRMAARKAKRMRKHDEEWFEANDSKCWNVTRQVCFWSSIVSMFGTLVAAAVLIYFMPRQCDPDTQWYQGTVFMDLRPEGYKFDLEATTARLPKIRALGVRAVHLKGLTEDPSSATYFPTASAMSAYEKMFGKKGKEELEVAIKHFIDNCHLNNLTVLVQIPVVGQKNESAESTMSLELEFSVAKAVEFWAKCGVDGIFLEGLEHFGADKYVAQVVTHWRTAFQKYSGGSGGNHKKIFMTSYLFAHNLQEAENGESELALSHVDLLDATIPFSATNFSELSDRVDTAVAWDVIKGRPWINWNSGSSSDNMTKAQLSFLFMLPGTITVPDLVVEDVDTLAGNLTAIRSEAVPIFMNGNYRRCECEGGLEKETNFALREPVPGLVQLERFYNRRNRYILVANFGGSGSKELDLARVADIYSAGELVLDTSRRRQLDSEVRIAELKLEQGQAFVIKLPK